MPGAYNRTDTYFRKDGKNGLDAVLAAEAALLPVPEYEGLIHFLAAMKILKVSKHWLRRLLKEYSYQVEKKPGKRKNGRPLPRSYVPAEFVQKVKADRSPAGQAGGTMTVTEATTRLSTAQLKVERTSVYELIAAGLLTPEHGTGMFVITKANGKVLRHLQDCLRVPTAEVEELRRTALLLAGRPPGPRRPGRQPSLLRRAAEAIRDREYTTTATRTGGGGNGASTTEPAAVKRRKKRKRELHEHWNELHKSGMSYEQVALKHQDETGQEVSWHAVAKAIKRLRNA